MLCAQTRYDKRPEGYDRLGSYAGGSNEQAARLQFFTPTLMTIKDAETASDSSIIGKGYSAGDTSRNKDQQAAYTDKQQGPKDQGTEHRQREKVMTWPMQYAMPGEQLQDALSGLPEPTIPGVERVRVRSRVVAVARFDVAATEPVVRGYTRQLMAQLRADGLEPQSSHQPYSQTKVGVEEDVEEVTIGQYDALFSLNKRRNEVWVELERHLW